MAGLVGSEPLVSIAEARSFLRLGEGEDEALLAGLIRSASATCEAFIGQVLIERSFSEAVAPTVGWRRLAAFPVVSIDGVTAIGPGGSETVLEAGRVEVDIDHRQVGWIFLDPAIEGRVRVRGREGMASQALEVPEPIRQGILRLAGHMYASRDGDGGDPPAAVTALWRPYRRVRL